MEKESGEGRCAFVERESSNVWKGRCVFVERESDEGDVCLVSQFPGS